MKPRHLIISLLAVVLLINSCGVSRRKSSPVYHAGEPLQEGYTPRGRVVEVNYDCSVPGPTNRRMIVYLPEGYDDSPDTSYPVLYLLHGARGYETSWIIKGRAQQICDSLFSAGLATPCILVMPNVNQYNNDSDYDGSRRKEAFESIWEVDGIVESAFMDDVVATADSMFRTIPAKGSRALAGLSIGATQSAVISAKENQEFGYVGVLSPYFRVRGRGGPYREDTYGDFFENMEDQFSSDSDLNYRIYIGDSDFLRHSVYRFHRRLDAKGFKHDYIVLDGGHSWVVWRAALTDFLQNIFI